MTLLVLLLMLLVACPFLWAEEALAWLATLRRSLAALQLRYLHLRREHAYQAEQDRQALTRLSKRLKAIQQDVKQLPPTAMHAQKRQALEQQLVTVTQRLQVAQQKRG